MNTFNKFLEDNGVLEQYKKNVENLRKIPIPYDLWLSETVASDIEKRNWFVSGFPFDESSEGSTYWLSIYHKWEEVCKTFTGSFVDSYNLK